MSEFLKAVGVRLTQEEIETLEEWAKSWDFNPSISASAKLLIKIGLEADRKNMEARYKARTGRK